MIITGTTGMDNNNTVVTVGDSSHIIPSTEGDLMWIIIIIIEITIIINIFVHSNNFAIFL